MLRTENVDGAMAWLLDLFHYVLYIGGTGYPVLPLCGCLLWSRTPTKVPIVPPNLMRWWTAAGLSISYSILAPCWKISRRWGSHGCRWCRMMAKGVLSRCFIRVFADLVRFASLSREKHMGLALAFEASLGCETVPLFIWLASRPKIPVQGSE
ncbi:hypothetical protein BOTBODRAFT_28592 [Botryobasidium botryosum FD-172 SS1]|uniref:Uncharacterized protein n=1 Tax=Botryobasidium botryosum (strain FD-172 SS1) TaxID=930990 RepID=A0A067MWL9_BOTB1|nr:hypothetical protein BOTBODRAFT_28592 [Botryobasidium botryosum FD-172 SS1]